MGVHKKTNIIQSLFIKEPQPTSEGRSFYHDTGSANGEYSYSATRRLWKRREGAL